MAPGTAPPEPIDILRSCAETAPELWFPSTYAEAKNISRDCLNEPLWLLRQTGLLRVGDWVKGRGQGFALTPEGIAAVNDPTRIPKEIPTQPVPERSTVEPEEVRRPEPRPGETRFDRGEAVRAAALDPKPGLVTAFLLFANMIWFAVGLIVAWRLGVPGSDYLRDGDIPVLLKTGAVNGADILAGEWWRLVSCMFVHIGVLHLFGNLFALGTSGPLAESCLGRWRYAVVYFVSGLTGSCLAMALNPNVVLAGASGAVWGVLTSLFVWLYRYREHLPPHVVGHWLRVFGIVLLVNAGISFAPGVSWEGHLGGGVAGVIVSVLLDWSRPGIGRFTRVVLSLAVLIVALLGPAGLWIATMRTEAWNQLRTRIALRLLREQIGEWKPIPMVVDPAKLSEDVTALTNVELNRARAVQQSVTFALVSPGPGIQHDAREKLTQFRSNLATAKERFANGPGTLGRIRNYLNEADEFAKQLERLLDGGTMPTAEQWRTIHDARRKMEQTWEAIASP